MKWQKIFKIITLIIMLFLVFCLLYNVNPTTIFEKFELCGKREIMKIPSELKKSLDPDKPVDRGVIDRVMDLFSERVTPQGDTVQTAQIQKIQTPPLPGTPMPRVQTAQANINPTTNLTPTQEALLSPEEKIIAGRT